MQLTPEQIRLIKNSWTGFRGINPALIGDVFYSKLFLEQPALRRLFPKDMEEQYKKLIHMLSTIVARLDHLDDLAADIASLARRHVQYGVKPDHYKPVGNALLWTLEQGLGKNWNEDVKEAWTCCYAILSGAMMNAAASI